MLAVGLGKAGGAGGKQNRGQLRFGKGGQGGHCGWIGVGQGGIVDDRQGTGVEGRVPQGDQIRKLVRQAGQGFG